LELHHDKTIIYNTVKESFKHTNFGSSKKFLNESVNLLISNDVDKFYDNLFETAEMKAALLDICVLTFSTENTKLGGSVVTFSLPAGWSCPFAKACLKKVSREREINPEKVGTSKISKRTGEEVPYKGDVVVTKGKDAEFDCFAANQEMQYDALRANRWHNYDLLIAAGNEGGAEAQAELIIRSLEYFFDTDGEKNEVRIHESGDFYNGEYLKAWMLVAKKMPNIKFYAYTKSVPYVAAMEKQLKDIPNLSITLSQGGRKDADIENVDIKTSRVFNTPEEILKAGLILDLDDNLAKEKGGREKDFALLVHGTQKAGEMSQNKMRNETFMAYWKYRKKLNRRLGLPETNIPTIEQAKQAMGYIDSELKKPNKETAVTDLKFIKKLLNYVVKYNNYDFNKELINILPEKYRP
jgi:hypothetical protein